MLTAREAAALLGISVRSFYDLRLPCYKYGPRMARWDVADLEAYKRSCQYTSTSPSNAGAGPSCAASVDADTEHQNFSRLVGRGNALKPSISRKQRGCSHLRLVRSGGTR